MALFGSIGKTVTRIFKNPVTKVVFPVTAIGSLVASQGIHNIIRRLGSFENTPQVSTQDHYLNQYQPAQGYPVNYPYGGGYQTWDYSMQSPVFSTPPQVTPAQDYYLQQVDSSQTAPQLGWYP